MAEQAQGTERNLLSCLGLPFLPSIQPGTWMPTRLQLTPAQPRPASERREKVAFLARLIFFFIQNKFWILYQGTQSTSFEVWKHNILEKVGLFREIRNPCGGEGGGEKNNNAIIYKFFSRTSSSFPLFISVLLPAAFVVPATSQM